MSQVLSYDDLLEIIKEEESPNNAQILWTMLQVQAKYAEETTRLFEKMEWRLMKIANDMETMRLRR